jgi:two-component system sensor histidine kinase TtrS
MKLYRVMLILIAGLLVLQPGVSMANPQKTCSIGVLAHRGPEMAIRMWSPTINYLSSQVAGYDFRLVPLDLGGLHEAEEQGEVDFILTNPGHYVELEFHHGISRIATLMNDRHGGPSKVFGAVIFTRAYRKDIRSLADLKGKSFAAVDKAAFGGFQMAWRELKKASVDPFTDLSELRFMGFPQDEIVYAVRDGLLDAGTVRTVRTDILERMADQGVINLADFNVLNPQTSEDFPLLHSTRLYPEWAFAKTASSPDNLARDIVIALLQMSSDDPAAQAGRYIGWTVPLDYNRVHELFQELGIGPYQASGDVRFTDVLRRYWYWLVLLSGIIVFSVVLNILVKREVVRRTTQLSEANRELQDQILERRRAEKEIRELLDENRMLVGNSLSGIRWRCRRMNVAIWRGNYMMNWANASPLYRQMRKSSASSPPAATVGWLKVRRPSRISLPVSMSSFTPRCCGCGRTYWTIWAWRRLSARRWVRGDSDIRIQTVH